MTAPRMTILILPIASLLAAAPSPLRGGGLEAGVSGGVFTAVGNLPLKGNGGEIDAFVGLAFPSGGGVLVRASWMDPHLEEGHGLSSAESFTLCLLRDARVKIRTVQIRVSTGAGVSGYPRTEGRRHKFVGSLAFAAEAALIVWTVPFGALEAGLAYRGSHIPDSGYNSDRLSVTLSLVGKLSRQN